MSIVITDSGLGGLSICAAIEQGLRAGARGGPDRLVYVNAWPDEGFGYNDLPDIPARAAAFDRVLARLAAMAPERIVIACNTLSILYPLTAFSRTTTLPVHGIVEAGVRVFLEALAREPRSSIVLLGTRTTIASGVHRDRLVAAGVPASRIAGVACHGLGAAIDRDPGGPLVGERLASCAQAVVEADPGGTPVFAGLCCTHYGYVSGPIGETLSRALGRPVVAIDPNRQMVEDLLAEWSRGHGTAGAEAAAGAVRPVPGGGQDRGPAGSPPVEVVSKVAIDDHTRQGIGAMIELTSPATAAALRAYRHDPTLF